MSVPQEPGAAVAALVVFVLIGFLFLLCMARGRLSERQQTGVWVLWAVFFFSICGAMARGGAGNEAAPAAGAGANVAGSLTASK